MNSPHSEQPTGSIFRDMPYMGVIFVVVEAMKLGYSGENPDWANLGQGQPEVGSIEGAPPRLSEIPVLPGDYAYGPVEGLLELRDAIASHYNRLYRRGMKTQYSAENVTVCAGGRTTLTRTAAAIDRVRLGYFVPDYTAYEDLLSAFERIKPVLISLRPEENFSISKETLREIIRREKLQGLLISNPCNPTGKVVRGDELASWVELTRSEGCSLLIDEYYSHYIWETEEECAINSPVSSAAFIEDINRDPVVIVDGITKNFRYPGWRLGWAIGPKTMIRNITAAGSFIDGGTPRPMQRAAIEILNPARADQETNAVRAVFKEKRDLTLNKLKEVGIEFPLAPEGTFYAFGRIDNLQKPISNGMNFFREALKHQVLTVPGEFFDVNPGKLRKDPSPYQGFVRFSYGPPMKTLEQGLQRLQNMIRSV